MSIDKLKQKIEIENTQDKKKDGIDRQVYIFLLFTAVKVKLKLKPLDQLKSCTNKYYVKE